MLRKRTYSSKIKVNINFKNAKLMWIWVILFIGIQVFFTIQTATSGTTLAALEREEEELAKEKKLLSEKLIESSSLTAMGKKSAELGFVKPAKTLYVNADDFVAKLP